MSPLEAGSQLWLSGMGQDAARQGALSLIASGAVALASFGVAGGLAPGLRSGTLFCPSCVLDERGHDYAPDGAWRASLMHRIQAAKLPFVTEGSLLSLPHPLLDVGAKAAMRERHQSLAVDMESAAIASVAMEHGVPFIVLRAIVDERDDEVPAALQAGVDAWGRPLAGAMLLALLRRPSLLAQLPGLAVRMGKATRALHAAARAAGTELGRDVAVPC
ncbi:purine and other phosphorylase-like protein, family 1 [Dyella sp. C11]|uniref:phosphorylase family protein n=1 Tax=Dyella sp. C11 TaxID=2126991 RepID=UPI000D64D54D|nr:purine and other phosphorylase-like protein, family 1 [Dyella sp. C11]